MNKIYISYLYRYAFFIFLTIMGGEMAERFKAHAWKVCVLLKVPRVRIPVSPPLI